MDRFLVAIEAEMIKEGIPLDNVRVYNHALIIYIWVILVMVGR